jgi:RimJ/RimL family protein N-acetyltransferase
MSEIIKLELFEEKDFDRLIKWVYDEESLIQFAGPIFTFPLTNEQLYDYISNKERLPFKVIDSVNNIVIGHAEISPSEETNAIKICRILIGDKTKRGKGYGEKIIKSLLEIAFNELNKEKAELNVFDWNIGAIKCYEKVGFKINKNKTSTSVVKGAHWKAINMIINRSDMVLTRT